MSDLVRYVAGFLFTPNYEMVCLIQKKRGPPNIVSKLNAVGGKIEPGETALEAMQREFTEEAGVSGLAWNLYVVLKGNGWEVYFFACADEAMWRTSQQTDEKLRYVPVSLLSDFAVVPNVRWLVPMAISLERGETCAGFIVREGAEDYAHEVDPDGLNDPEVDRSPELRLAADTCTHDTPWSDPCVGCLRG